MVTVAEATIEATINATSEMTSDVIAETIAEATAQTISEATAGPAIGTALDTTERLFVPHRKRLFHEYAVGAEGSRELRIYYGHKEVVFDDPRYFAFGEQLATEASFTGEQASHWGPGYAWDELQPLLEQLVAEGILQRGAPVPDERAGKLVPSQLPPAVCPVPRSWSTEDCESISRDLTGWPVEIGYLEVGVPIYRVAHAALDADGRQVGEANVFPQALRLELETEWRACQYAGSRYRDPMPMNITALKAMIRYWKPMMATLMAVRGALRERLGPAPVQSPDASPGRPPEPWTIGELYVLSCVVLALPGYQLTRRGGSSPQRALHPVLSSLFRITDGIRMTTAHMLFSIEHTRRPEERVRGVDIYDRAEQEGLLLNGAGVCAGPRHLIDEFLRIAIDGELPDEIASAPLPDEIAALLTELPAVIDYGLYGVQIWGVSFAVWLAMSRATEALRAIFAPVAELGGPCTALCERLRSDWAVLEQQQLVLGYDRDVHWTFYADAYERSRRGARIPVGWPTLVEELAPVPDGDGHRAAAAQLRALLGARLTTAELAAIGGSPALARCAEVLVDYLREVQPILASCEQLAAAINERLERPQPQRRLHGRDLYQLYALSSAGTSASDRSFPYLPRTLESALQISIECTASAIEIADRRPILAGAAQAR